jgi:hypothetical protein
MIDLYGLQNLIKYSLSFGEKSVNLYGRIQPQSCPQRCPRHKVLIVKNYETPNKMRQHD